MLLLDEGAPPGYPEPYVRKPPRLGTCHGMYAADADGDSSTAPRKHGCHDVTRRGKEESQILFSAFTIPPYQKSS